MVIQVILIIGLGVIVYSNTFLCPFHFDDKLFIIDNVAIRNIQDLGNIWAYYPGRCVTFLSIALNYHFNGLSVFGYHLFNLMVHIISSLLVWWLTLLTFSTPAMKDPAYNGAGNIITRHANWIAFLVGLVFVAHPIQTGAVTYIWQRAASMTALFYLASLCFYVKSRFTGDPAGRLYYVLSLITAVLAMFTKENAITLPLMILLYEFYFFGAKKNLNWGRLIPFLLVIFIIPSTMVLTKSINIKEMHRAAEGPLTISPVHYLLTQFRVIVTYIRLFFFPFNQNLDYDYPIFKNIFEIPVLTAIVFIITILVSAKSLFLKYRLLSFSIIWFFLTLLPESSIVPFNDVIFEYRLYLPSVGCCIFLVISLYYLFGKDNLKAMVIVLIMIITCYSILAYQRNKVWKDDMTLWSDTVQKSPQKSRPLNNRGMAYLALGNTTQAMVDFNRAIELNPNNEDAYSNRGSIYSKQGQWTQAMVDFNKAILLNPRDPNVYCNIGLMYYKQGHMTQAISAYTKAIELNPSFAEVYKNRSFAYHQQGHLIQAILDLTKAIEINHDDAGAYSDRGSIEGEGNNFTQAIVDFTKAVELNPGYAGAYYNRAGTYYFMREYDNAWKDVHQAEALGYAADPGFINALIKSSGQNK